MVGEHLPVITRASRLSLLHAKRGRGRGGCGCAWCGGEGAAYCWQQAVLWRGRGWGLDAHGGLNGGAHRGQGLVGVWDGASEACTCVSASHATCQSVSQSDRQEQMFQGDGLQVRRAGDGGKGLVSVRLTGVKVNLCLKAGSLSCLL